MCLVYVDVLCMCMRAHTVRWWRSGSFLIVLHFSFQGKVCCWSWSSPRLDWLVRKPRDFWFCHLQLGWQAHPQSCVYCHMCTVMCVQTRDHRLTQQVLTNGTVSPALCHVRKCPLGSGRMILKSTSERQQITNTLHFGSAESVLSENSKRLLYLLGAFLVCVLIPSPCDVRNRGRRKSCPALGCSLVWLCPAHTLIDHRAYHVQTYFARCADYTLAVLILLLG